jgi:hypothetical protein
MPGYTPGYSIPGHRSRPRPSPSDDDPEFHDKPEWLKMIQRAQIKDAKRKQAENQHSPKDAEEAE